MDYKKRVVALLDKPSTNSFGICGLVVKNEESEFYEVIGFASGTEQVTQREFDMYSAHILQVESHLLPSMINPCALWLGEKFCIKSEELRAPPLPMIDNNWYQVTKESKGWYTLKESLEAYRVLDYWVTAAAKEALLKNDFELASLMLWALPLSLKTGAALYFTQTDDKKRQRELDWQVKLSKDARKPVSCESLIEEYEKIKSILLSNGE